MREMTVYGVSFDMVGKQPIVLLKTQDGNKFLPIWIGHPEAAAILMKLQDSAPPRPMTHDLMTSMLDQLDAEVVKITVTELRDNTFYARITIVQDGQEIEVDSRPSDAIALAVRANARIFATDEVIEESGIVIEGDDEETEARIARVSALADLDPDEFRRFLDTVTPDEFAQDVDEEDAEAEDDQDEVEER
ncbi:MAG TPA: bifunctional nuclease family protein [Gaiellaceae bacterium]|jgi:bifunctional DNase/RNase